MTLKVTLAIVYLLSWFKQFDNKEKLLLGNINYNNNYNYINHDYNLVNSLSSHIQNKMILVDSTMYCGFKLRIEEQGKLLVNWIK